MFVTVSAVFSHSCCSGHVFSSLLVLSLGNVTAPPAAVAGAAGRGRAGCSGGGFPRAAARRERSAPRGGGGVQHGQRDIRAPGRGRRRAGGRAGPGESGCDCTVVVLDC